MRVVRARWGLRRKVRSMTSSAFTSRMSWAGGLRHEPLPHESGWLRPRLPQQQRRPDVRVAPPLALVLGNKRDLMPPPRLERNPARLVSPSDRVEHLEAVVAAPFEQTGLVPSRGVKHRNPQADPAHLALHVTVDDIDAG